MKILLLMIAAAVVAAAAPPVDPIYKDKQGIAINGYDPVAYFQEGKPVKGSSAFAEEWMGAKWQFTSAETRDAFRSSPEKYAPQFGGYCAWAVGHGYTAKTDPDAWRIIDGRLYLNYDKDVQKKWQQDTAKYIEEGTRNWPKLHK
jgi:YHS domain-containing protein